MAFHAGRASIASIVSNVCACSPGPGTLCTFTPASTMSGGSDSADDCAVVPRLSAWPRAPGASSSVNARNVLAATPGRSW